MPQLVPFYFINQVTFAFAIIAILIFVFSKYILPRFLHFLHMRKFNLFISMLFFLLLLLPFKLILPLLNLGYLFPVIAAFYACIFTTISVFTENKHKLLSLFQLLYVFTFALVLSYIFYYINQHELVYFLFAFFPMLVEGGVSEFSVFLPSKIALFMENNSPEPPVSTNTPESPRPPNSPAPSTNSSSSSSTFSFDSFYALPSPRTPPPPTFEDLL